MLEGVYVMMTIDDTQGSIGSIKYDDNNRKLLAQ